MPGWLPLSLYLLFYAILYSLLAASAVKRWVAAHVDRGIDFYCLAYVALSMVLLVPLLWIPLPPESLYEVPSPYSLVLPAIQMVGAGAFV